MIGPGNLVNANTAISIESISPKQLLGECLELATQMFKQVVEVFTQTNQYDPPFGSSQKVDFSLLANYMLEPARLQRLLTQFILDQQKTSKALCKSWLFELKYLRNSWAHSPTEAITYRLANRGFDTLSLLFLGFRGDQNSDLFKKIEFYRKKLLVATAKEYTLS